MLSYISDYLTEVEERQTIEAPEQAFKALRKLGLNDFGNVLWNCPLVSFPNLSRHLPDMASPEVQKKWTGFTDDHLLDQSVSFVRSASENYLSLTGHDLKGKTILDYGCGYGRFLRLFRYYTNDVWGVDPWDESLAESSAAGFGDRLRKIDTIPTSLPAEITFDFAFAFSIFTHLNETAAKAALAAMRKAAAPGAVLCITIRPIEYWNGRFRAAGAERKQRRAAMIARHRNHGFAFAPSGIRASDPEGCYGHASMDIGWLHRAADGWRVAATDRSINDPMQRYVYLTVA